MNEAQLKNIIEAALLAAGKTLSVDDILALFDEQEQPGREQIRDAINSLQEEFAGRAIELKQVSSGYRIQVREGFSEWISRLWSERPSRYSRALLETLALIAYRQPITRGEIEDIRGVSVSSSILKTMQERDWIRVLGHRDVPGKPAMYGTTRQFLDYFNIRSLDELPTLDELRDLDQINAELDLGIPGVPEATQAEDGSVNEEEHATAGTEDEEVQTETAASDAESGETATMEAEPDNEAAGSAAEEGEAEDEEMAAVAGMQDEAVRDEAPAAGDESDETAALEQGVDSDAAEAVSAQDHQHEAQAPGGDVTQAQDEAQDQEESAPRAELAGS